MGRTKELSMDELRNLTDPLIHKQEEFNWEHFRAQYNNEQPKEEESELTKFVRERIRKFYER